MRNIRPRAGAETRLTSFGLTPERTLDRRGRVVSPLIGGHKVCEAIFGPEKCGTLSGPRTTTKRATPSSLCAKPREICVEKSR